MRVRCPNGNHQIELHDDMLGARVRCVLCGHLFFVEPELCEGASEQIQVKATPGVPATSDAKNLGEQIYDGLPPLSLMIALRRQQGKHQEADELAAKLEMTPDDWKALDAYESALRAAYSIRTSVIVGGFALACNLPQLAFSASDESAPHDWAVILLVGFVGACLGALWFGSLSLQKINLSTLVRQLTLVLVAAALAFALAAVNNIYRLLSVRSVDAPFFVVFAIPFAVLSLIDLGKSGLRTQRAIEQTQPPEITNRLTEALKYLE